MMQPKGFLVMGVAGSGKSTLGKALAEQLSWDFFDADDFHSVENISKMTAGVPLADADRTPWLVALNHKLISTLRENRHPVLACSALKESYRALLLAGADGMAIIYLKGSYDLIWTRISAREGHYMKSEMLQSQISALEEPGNALVLDIALPLNKMLGTIFEHYSMLKRSSK
jgi:gluconokinase